MGSRLAISPCLNGCPDAPTDAHTTDAEGRVQRALYRHLRAG
jgi:hypothetical protein